MDWRPFNEGGRLLGLLGLKEAGCEGILPVLELPTGADNLGWPNFFWGGLVGVAWTTVGGLYCLGGGEA